METPLINKETLDYIFRIVKYFHFNVKIGQTVTVKSLTAEHKRDQFISAMTSIIDRNFCLLGGFSINWVGDSREEIQKIPHIFIDKAHETSNDYVISIDHYRRTDENTELIRSDVYKNALIDGNS